MMRMIRAASGHKMTLHKMTADEFAGIGLNNFVPERYASFYNVRHDNTDWKTVFYIARWKARRKSSSEWHVWYRNSKEMWSSYGGTIQEAIDGAQRDGWLHA